MHFAKTMNMTSWQKSGIIKKKSIIETIETILLNEKTKNNNSLNFESQKILALFRQIFIHCTDKIQ